jgi:hypothetical protein
VSQREAYREYWVSQDFSSMRPSIFQAEFYRMVRRASIAYPEWRVGQRFFNVLARMDPVLADMIRGTSADPFYDDSKIPAFELALWG